MKRSDFQPNSAKGFTLIEVIATIIIMGILAAFFVHFMGTALNSSWQSVRWVADEGEAEATLESIIAFYTAKINEDPDTALSAVKNADFGSDVTMQYITFSAGNEVVLDPTPSNNLKIAVQAPGLNLTTILTKSRRDASDPPVYW